ncbi:hypothetical protein H9635_16680 [Solibacillus sp. A46]|uniref:Uncharacterized protein n=1 Tax=Solibacillus faecavium TaxID=2762221 RepID=A0ABR8Y2F1_9BACL|nr:DUF6773 family protein [Solibacillus faecavium]MBD8038385.1 hypothetical protein [Solibacillus faecavium]
MGLFKRKIVDERVQNLQNKIYREMYYIVSIICFISIITKLVIYGRGIESVAIELIISLTCSIYYIYRAMYTGVLSEEVEIHDANSKYRYSTKTIIFGILIGVVIALAMGLNSGINYADSNAQAIEYFFMVSLISLLFYAPFLALFLYIINQSAVKKSQQVNDKMLKDDEDTW